MDSLQDYDYQQLSALVAELGVPKFRADQLYSLAMRHKSYDEGSNLPVALREQLKGVVRDRAVEIVERLEGKDGVKKYLYLLSDGNIIEGVYMPHRYGDTLCVSTQVGCRMGCAFCASGIGGLVRNLTAGEILGQVLAANRDNGGTPEKRKVTNVVLMGSGEPLDNYDNVMRAIEVLTSDWGFGWSPKRITVSTIGVLPALKRYLDESRCHLAVSLHNPFPEERLSVMPAEKAFHEEDIVRLIRQYDFSGQRRVSFEYTMFSGFNDSIRHADALSRMLRGLECRVNLIRFHEIPDFPYGCPPDAVIRRFQERLNANGILATVRASRGEDIMAACGMLAGKFKEDS